jgi:hypothetical protein
MRGIQSQGAGVCMKVASLIRVLVSVAVLVVLGASVASAQTEIDPDHFDFANAEPFSQPTAAASKQVALSHYDGNFTLPFAVVSGRNLPPSKCAIFLRFNDKVAQATPKSNGQVIRLLSGVYRRSSQRGTLALIVAEKGKTPAFSAIHAASLNFIFDAGFPPETALKRMLIPIESSP